MPRRLLALALVVPVLLPGRIAAGASLRFHGGSDIDRVRLALHDPTPSPTDGGGTGFTGELWVKGFLAENAAPAWDGDPAGPGIGGNVVLDAEGPEAGAGGWAISLGAGRIRFRVAGGSATLDGVTSVLDGDWHHVAVQWIGRDGRLEIWVDGALDASGPGPRGDRSRAVPAPGAAAAEGSLVIGGPRASGAGALAFSGWVDEVRVSRGRRHDAPFARPAGSFRPDPDTIALGHFDEGAPTPGPEASAESPFDAVRGTAAFPAEGELEVEAYPNPDLGQTLLWVRSGDGRDGDVAVDIRDAHGRRATRLAGTLRHGAAMLVWTGHGDDGVAAGPGVYFARVVGSTREGAKIVLP